MSDIGEDSSVRERLAELIVGARGSVVHPEHAACGRCGDARAAADAILAAGWRPPLPDTLSPWDAYRDAYEAFRRDTPSWRAHFTAHHMHALEAALRVYDPCAEHGGLLHRYVAASLEFDYTAEGDCGGEYDADEQEHEAALANIAEMHRLLNLRAERLAEAHEKLRDQTSPLPDSETEWGWKPDPDEPDEPRIDQIGTVRQRDDGTIAVKVSMGDDTGKGQHVWCWMAPSLEVRWLHHYEVADWPVLADPAQTTEQHAERLPFAARLVDAAIFESLRLSGVALRDVEEADDAAGGQP